MKITKRYWYSTPTTTMHMWLIPASAYTLQKVAGTEFNQYEWLWWVVTTLSFTLWFITNFKVISNAEEK